MHLFIYIYIYLSMYRFQVEIQLTFASRASAKDSSKKPLLPKALGGRPHTDARPWEAMKWLMDDFPQRPTYFSLRKVW